MGLQLESIVPWGRNLDEYVRMFALTEGDRQRRILDCAAGPASFNAEITQQGGSVVSVDPVYAFSAAQIEQRVQATRPQIVAQLQASYDDYVWQTIPTPQQLGQLRLATMQRFLQDLPIGLAEGRYQTGELPTLPFPDRHFDLALCGHCLFTYSHLLSPDFHLAALRELCRVATEARIFPLLTLDNQPAPALAIALQTLPPAGYTLQIRPVPYEFQKGGNQMLAIKKIYPEDPANQHNPKDAVRPTHAKRAPTFHR